MAISHRKSERNAAETDTLVRQALEQCVHEAVAHDVNHTQVQADVSDVLKEDEPP